MFKIINFQLHSIHFEEEFPELFLYEISQIRISNEPTNLKKNQTNLFRYFKQESRLKISNFILISISFNIAQTQIHSYRNQIEI